MTTEWTFVEKIMLKPNIIPDFLSKLFSNMLFNRCMTEVCILRSRLSEPHYTAIGLSSEKSYASNGIKFLPLIQ